jgi:hypothetical protein
MEHEYKGVLGICMALLAMDFATKKDQDWTKCWTYMGLLM